MKVKETKQKEGGMFQGVPLHRVVEIPDGTPLPEGAVEVPAETAVYDWNTSEVEN